VEAADLANELQRGVVKLGSRRSVVRVPQPLDVPTHLSPLPFLIRFLVATDAAHKLRAGAAADKIARPEP